MFPRRNNTHATPPIAFETMLAKFPDSPLLSDLRGALAKTIADYRSAHDDAGRIAGDRTLTDGARLVRQSTVVRAKMESALTALESAKNKTAVGRKANEKALLKPLDFSTSNLSEISVAAELRAHVKGLPLAERGAFVLAAVKDMDLPSLRAIAAVPSFLSGLPDQIHALARDQLLLVLAPEPLAASKILAEGEAAAQELTDHIAQATANLVDFESADQLAKASA